MMGSKIGVNAFGPWCNSGLWLNWGLLTFAAVIQTFSQQAERQLVSLWWLIKSLLFCWPDGQPWLARCGLRAASWWSPIIKINRSSLEPSLFTPEWTQGERTQILLRMLEHAGLCGFQFCWLVLAVEEKIHTIKLHQAASTWISKVLH